MRLSAGQVALCGAMLALIILAIATSGIAQPAEGWVLLALRDIAVAAPAILTDVMRAVSWIGDFPRRLAVVLLAALWLWRCGQGRSALMLIAMLLAGALLTEASKALLLRPRPDLMVWWTHADGWSLPSGHATGAALAYGAAGWLVARTVAPPWRANAVRLAALLLVLLVGLSRLWLGVHWPLDVLAGWLLGGTLAATVCWLAAGDRAVPRAGA